MHNGQQMQFQFIRDIHAARLAAGKPVISFEFFPPKTDEGDRNLLEKTVPALLQLKPDFCSVTYGAGGSTRDKTLMIVDRIQREHRLTAMLHLTCVSATEAQVAEVVEQARGLGIKNILALRGDPVAGSNAEFTKTEGGFEYSYQLVKFLRQAGGFSIGTAGFPEGHVACKAGKHADWDHLINKINCGADFVVTQLFFDNADFFEFRDYLVKRGVKVPLVPGIIPIHSTHQIKRFTALCGAKLPASLLASLEEFADDDQAATRFGIDYATRQCADLLKAGVPGLHMYTLNKAPSTIEIIRNLNLS
jgi:methylenetetrahydrofolate reductase (NADPH)